MPKVKSHSGAKKRFFKTAGGFFRYKKTRARHLLTGKPSSKMRRIRKQGILNKTDAKEIQRILPYL